MLSLLVVIEVQVIKIIELNLDVEIVVTLSNTTLEYLLLFLLA